MKAWLEQLHRGAQWYKVPDAKRTSLQRLAARTLGLVTLSNAATIIGAITVIVGLSNFYSGNYVVGFILVGVGRCFDLLDGYLARKTQTSSPFGEGLDAGFDKLVILFTAFTAIFVGVLPISIGVLFLLEQVVTAIATLAGRRHGVKLHPTRFGKYTTFAIWVIIGLYLLSYWLTYGTENGLSAGNLLYIISTLLALCIIVMRFIAMGKYLAIIRRKSQAGKHEK